MQLPQRISLIMLGINATSIPSIVNSIVNSNVRNPVPIQFDQLSSTLAMALVGGRPTGKPTLPFCTQSAITVVLDRFQTCPDFRLKEIMMRLVQHLHSLILEATISPEELGLAIGFLTRVGQRCAIDRQEMVMLSDVLGVEALVEELSYEENLLESKSLASPGSLLGPFHVAGATVLPNGSKMFSEKSRSDESVFCFQGIGNDAFCMDFKWMN